MLKYQTELKYHLHKDGSEIWQICRTHADIEKYTKELEADGYKPVLDNPTYIPWSEMDIVVIKVRNFEFVINVKQKFVSLFYKNGNVGRVGVYVLNPYNDGFEFRSTPKSGFNRPIPKYVLFAINVITKKLLSM